MESVGEYFCKSLPKVELHAHLVGSISREFIQKSVQKRIQENPTERLPDIKIGQIRSVDDLYSSLDFAQKVCLSSLEDIFTITCEVVKDYAADNVKYLELRSVPVELSGKYSKRQYVEALLAAFDHCNQEGWDIDVKYLISIDRSQDISVAQEGIQLAKELTLSHQGIGGVDLSGCPKLGDARIFIPLLSDAKKSGLKLSLHCAEFPGRNSETKALLELRPDRLGKAVYLDSSMGGSHEIMTMVETQKIPLEFTLTSNVKTGVVPNLSAHPFGYWHSKGHPCTLGCDCKGLYNTSLTNEYLIAARSFQLNPTQVWEFSMNSINYIFADEETKSRLRMKWRMWQAHEAPSFTYFFENQED